VLALAGVRLGRVGRGARGEPAGRKVWSALACGRARCVAGTNNADFSAKEKAAERVPGR
jgi:hypothetical protein